MKVTKSHGTPQQFEDAVKRRIDELGGDIESCDKITSSTDSNGWWTKYYNVVDAEACAKHMGCDVEDFSSENMSGYNYEHLGYLVAKDEYADELYEYDGLDLVNEGGDIFPAQFVGGRMYDVSDQIRQCVLTSDEFVKEIKSKLASVGVDVDSAEAEDYAEAAAELIAADDDHDVEYWWRETLADEDFKAEVDALPHINASTKVCGAEDEDDDTFRARYLHSLMGDIEAELGNEVNGVQFDTTDNELIVTVSYEPYVREFSVPFDDLNFDFDEMDQDTAYVVNTILYDLDTLGEEKV